MYKVDNFPSNGVTIIFAPTCIYMVYTVLVKFEPWHLHWRQCIITFSSPYPLIQYYIIIVDM